MTRSPLPGVPANYRNNPYRAPSMKLRVHNRDVSVDVAQTLSPVTVLTRKDGQITLAIDGITRTYEIKQVGEEIFVHSPTSSLAITRLARYPRPAGATQRETANSPMPGQVLRVLVKEGQEVKTGDSLVVLEAMKMEQTIRTNIDGVVKSILVVKGQVVAPGQMLVQISAQEKNPK